MRIKQRSNAGKLRSLRTKVNVSTRFPCSCGSLCLREMAEKQRARPHQPMITTPNPLLSRAAALEEDTLLNHYSSSSLSAFKGSTLPSCAFLLASNQTGWSTSLLGLPRAPASWFMSLLGRSASERCGSYVPARLAPNSVGQERSCSEQRVLMPASPGRGGRTGKGCQLVWVWEMEQLIIKVKSSEFKREPASPIIPWL